MAGLREPARDLERLSLEALQVYGKHAKGFYYVEPMIFTSS